MLKETLYVLNQKVLIRADHPWAAEALAVIVEAPVEVRSLANEWETGYSRVFRTPRGLTRSYWLRFEFAHIDADGDGPYAAAEIEEFYIQRA